MKNKFFAFNLIVLVFFLSAPLSGQTRVIDNAGILSAENKATLESMIEKISSAYNFDLIIYTERDIGGVNPIDYSWAFLDAAGLGGETWDGCLFLQATANRNYAFTASGRGSKILNPAAYSNLEGKVLAHLRNNDFFGAYLTYISIWEKYLALEANGRSYNIFTRYNLIFTAISWVLSLLIGLFVLRSWKAKMNTVLPKTEADAYMVPGSLNFTKQSDRFLYSTMTRIRRENRNSGQGGFSGSGGGRISRGGRY